MHYSWERTSDAFRLVLCRVDAVARKIPIIYENFGASSGWLYIVICFCAVLQNLVGKLKVFKNVQEVLKSSSEMIDLQLKRLMSQIGGISSSFVPS